MHVGFFSSVFNKQTPIILQHVTDSHLCIILWGPLVNKRTEFSFFGIVELRLGDMLCKVLLTFEEIWF